MPFLKQVLDKGDISSALCNAVPEHHDPFAGKQAGTFLSRGRRRGCWRSVGRISRRREKDEGNSEDGCEDESKTIHEVRCSLCDRYQPRILVCPTGIPWTLDFHRR